MHIFLILQQLSTWTVDSDDEDTQLSEVSAATWQWAPRNTQENLSFIMNICWIKGRPVSQISNSNKI